MIPLHSGTWPGELGRGGPVVEMEKQGGGFAVICAVTVGLGSCSQCPLGQVNTPQPLSTVLKRGVTCASLPRSERL